MTKRPEPAIPLFGDAYLADTRHLSLEEHGAYMQLLMIAWRSEGCALPDDDARLARMLSITPGKWGKIKPTVMAFWECVEGKWRQRRLTKEREFIEEKRAKNSASAKAMWEAKSLENIEGEGCERNSKRNAPLPLPQKKEGSVAKATGTVVPFSPVDLKAEVFRSAVALLESTGTPQAKGRPMIGRWLKDYGEAEVLAVLTDATARAIAAPIPWITATLEKRYGRKRTGDPILAALRDAEAECAAEDQEARSGAGSSLPPRSTGSA